MTIIVSAGMRENPYRPGVGKLWRWDRALMALAREGDIMVRFGPNLVRPLDKRAFMRHLVKLRERIHAKEPRPQWVASCFKIVVRQLSFGHDLSYKMTRAVRLLADAKDMNTVPMPFTPTDKAITDYFTSGAEWNRRKVARVTNILGARAALAALAVEKAAKEKIGAEALQRRKAMRAAGVMPSGHDAQHRYTDPVKRRLPSDKKSK
jgi:hypothetical protein